jgi:hypothetical protein
VSEEFLSASEASSVVGTPKEREKELEGRFKDPDMPKKRNALAEFLIREGQNKVRIPLDPILGYMLAQGTFLQHIIFGVVNLYLIAREPTNYTDEPLD